eukprot:2104375-Pyramimonas_sp.AAC.1
MNQRPSLSARLRGEVRRSHTNLQHMNEAMSVTNNGNVDDDRLVGNPADRLAGNPSRTPGKEPFVVNIR